jgi:hypothetical protein
LSLTRSGIVIKTLPKYALVWFPSVWTGAKFISLKGTALQRMGFKMLNCQICAARVDVLAHQIRGRNEVAVCLDCADRYYQDQLTRTLINAEKVGA